MNNNNSYSDDVYNEYSGSYPELVNEVLEYIINEREFDETLSIIDLICSFCVKHNYNPIMVGDAISDDFYFKKLIENEILASNSKETEW